MARPRRAHLFASASFAGIIFSVPIIQAILELRQGERPQALDVFAQKPTVENLRAYEAALGETSWAVKNLRPWMQYVQFVLLKEAGEKALLGRDDWLFYKPGVAYLTRRPGEQNVADDIADPLPAIVSFRDQLAARGIQLLVVPAPNKESVYPEKLTRRTRHMGVVMCPDTRELSRQLKAAGVEVVDLFAVFHDAKKANGMSLGRAFYLAQDSHWSPAGVELAAKSVAQRVLERGWVSPGTLEYAETAVRLQRLGDLVRMLQSHQIERRLCPQDILCKQVISQDSRALYQDAPDSEILVLGDSFLRIYEQDEPGAAGFVAHLAKELKQALSSIVNDGGASTLVRQELYRRPQLLANKKLVIWEFVERDIRFGTEGWQLVPLPPASAPGAAE